MEVHASPTEAAGEQVRVPDVEGEDWEDAADTVLDSGFESGNVVAVADRHPRWSVISQSPKWWFAPRAGRGRHADPVDGPTPSRDGRSAGVPSRRGRARRTLLHRQVHQVLSRRRAV